MATDFSRIWGVDKVQLHEKHLVVITKPIYMQRKFWGFRGVRLKLTLRRDGVDFCSLKSNKQLGSHDHPSLWSDMVCLGNLTDGYLRATREGDWQLAVILVMKMLDWGSCKPRESSHWYW